MSNNTDLKALWSKQIVPVANPEDILKRIERFKRKRARKVFILNCILWLTVLLVLLVRICFKPQLMITQIGVILTILSISIVILFNCKLIPLYKRTHESQTNSGYLNDLLAMKSREKFMQTKIMGLYFISLSTGIGLCMYEYTFQRSLGFGLTAYSLFALWVGINWFYLRAKIIKKNERKRDKLIKQIEAIQSQLESSERLS